MRTTISMTEALYRRAKARAAERGQTVSALVEDAVRVALESRPVETGTARPLPVFGGSGVMPGVELTDNAAMRQLMDGDTAIDALR